MGSRAVSTCRWVQNGPVPCGLRNSGSNVRGGRNPALADRLTHDLIASFPLESHGVCSAKHFISSSEGGRAVMIGTFSSWQHSFILLLGDKMLWGCSNGWTFVRENKQVSAEEHACCSIHKQIVYSRALLLE